MTSIRDNNRNARSRSTFFRHSALLSLPGLLLRNVSICRAKADSRFTSLFRLKCPSRQIIQYTIQQTCNKGSMFIHVRFFFFPGNQWQFDIFPKARPFWHSHWRVGYLGKPCYFLIPFALGADLKSTNFVSSEGVSGAATISIFLCMMWKNIIATPSMFLSIPIKISNILCCLKGPKWRWCILLNGRCVRTIFT